MPQTYAANFVHCVFSTKDRRDLIPESMQEKLYAYLLGIANNLGITLIATGWYRESCSFAYWPPAAVAASGGRPETQGQFLTLVG